MRRQSPYPVAADSPMVRLTYNGMSATYPTIAAALESLRECLADGPGVVVTVEAVGV